MSQAPTAAAVAAPAVRLTLHIKDAETGYYVPDVTVKVYPRTGAAPLSVNIPVLGRISVPSTAAKVHEQRYAEGYAEVETDFNPNGWEVSLLHPDYVTATYTIPAEGERIERTFTMRRKEAARPAAAPVSAAAGLPGWVLPVALAAAAFVFLPTIIRKI
jgi:hypothetical protein